MVCWINDVQLLVPLSLTSCDRGYGTLVRRLHFLFIDKVGNSSLKLTKNQKKNSTHVEKLYSVLTKRCQTKYMGILKNIKIKFFHSSIFCAKYK